MEDQAQTLEKQVAEEINKILVMIENANAAGIKSNNLKFAQASLVQMVNDKDKLDDYYLETLYYTSMC